MRGGVDVDIGAGPFGGFGIEDIHPGKLADSQVVIAESYAGIGHQGGGFILEGREGAQQVGLDQPGSGMMGTDIAGSGIGTLHGERPVGAVE